MQIRPAYLNHTSVKQAKAFTIIEAMLAALILTIAFSGAMVYRYNSAVDARKAEAKITAGRIAVTLLESWRGTGGSSLFSPVDNIGTGIFDSSGHSIGIYSSETGILPDGFTRLASTSYPDYRVVVSRNNYYVTLSYKDVDSDSDSIDDIRLLNADVHWRRDFGPGTVTNSDKYVRLTTCMGL